MTTLRYTDRAKNIKKAPKDAMIRIYQEELNLLKEGLVAASGGKINLDLFSGKIISVSGDKSIKIFDTNLNVIDKILNSHEQGIFYIDVIDENTFATCTNDLIKIWNIHSINVIN